MCDKKSGSCAVPDGWPEVGKIGQGWKKKSASVPETTSGSNTGLDNFKTKTHSAGYVNIKGVIFLHVSCSLVQIKSLLLQASEIPPPPEHA